MRVEAADREKEDRVWPPAGAQGKPARELEDGHAGVPQDGLDPQLLTAQVEAARHVDAQFDDGCLRVGKDGRDASEERDADGHRQAQDQADVGLDDLGASPPEASHQPDGKAVACDREHRLDVVEDLHDPPHRVDRKQDRIEDAGADFVAQYGQVHGPVHAQQTAQAGEGEAKAQLDRWERGGEDHQHAESIGSIGQLGGDQAQGVDRDHVGDGQ